MVIGRIKTNSASPVLMRECKHARTNACLHIQMRKHVRPIVCLYLRMHACRPIQAGRIANMFVLAYAYMYTSWQDRVNVSMHVRTIM